jgi:hypothetical protein
MWFEAASITCKVEIVKAPVLPVPDYALKIVNSYKGWIKTI